jgi:hypothetical protein
MYSTDLPGRGAWMTCAGLPCVLRATRQRFTCGSTALTMITSTLARMAKPICIGGRPHPRVADNTLASSLTSTTTDTGTR